MPHSVSAATVTRDQDGRVLLIQRVDNGAWQIPGGVVESGEAPVEAAARETLEETGIEVRVRELSGVYTNTVRDIVALVFVADPVDGIATTTDESAAVEWVDFDEAISRMDAVFAPRIADARIEGVQLRSHDGTRITD